MCKPKINKATIFCFFFLLIIISIFQYGVQKVCGFSLYPDEFGYWASAANAVGYNWAEVASMGSYYSFGYSLILVPVLKIFSDGVMAYRAAIAVNMLLMCAGFCLVQKIARKLFPDMDEVKGVFISGIAVLYPSWIFYMQMTMAEALLFFMFVLITWFLLSYIDKPKTVTAVLLAVTLVYIYCVHMRTVGIVIACVVTIFLHGIANPERKKEVIPFVALMIVLIIAGWISLKLKSQTISEVFAYAREDVLAGNDYGRQWDKLEKIFTFSGIVLLCKGILGKIFYLGLASFGIFYWSLGWCLKESIGLIRKLIKKKTTSIKQWCALFLLLAAAGQILISSIYMFQAEHIDCLIYGRYNELLIPVMMLVGIVVMEKSKFLFPATMVMGMLSGGMALAFLNVVEQEGMAGLRGYHIAGLSYLIQEDDLNVYYFFRDTWLLGFGLMLLVCVLLWLCRHLKGGVWILTGILLVEIKAGLQTSEHYTYRVNNTNFENRRIVEVIQENCGEESTVTYLDEGHPAFVDFIQMQLPEKSIHVVKEEELDNQEALGDFVITYAESKHNEQLQEKYKKKITASTFCLYFNQDT